MKKAALLTLFLALMAIVPVAGFAADVSLEGTIQGYTCVTFGKTCPVGQEDPLAAVEQNFVLLKEMPDDYYFIPNVDANVLSRHINEKIRVTGTQSPKFKSIKANRIESYRNGQWVKVWSDTDQDNLEKWMNSLSNS